MKKSLTLGMTLLLSALFLQACSPATPGTSTSESREPSETSTETDDAPLRFDFDFNKGDEGFTAGFSDLPIDHAEDIYGLDSGLAPLPEELGDGQGFRITGMNRSDDLFMFLERELTTADGIKPNQSYDVQIEIEFGSNAFANSFGIGGSPAESVYVKAGATNVKPEAIEGMEADVPMFQMNIDKGQQSEGGADAKVIGNVAKQDGSEDESFALVKLNSDDVELSVTSDADGRLWLIVGTDSGFEGLTELYYTSIRITLTP